ncbi:MAG: type I glyceraldehyde-3-phosphate dehydrogenase [Patescibacteria group bacterium]|nr:type I glyceraldehyde-3-phosphate dehydrogenase [Patescibacteria group bacterium]
MMTKIAINGFGRIGRLCLRHILENHPGIEVIAINDLSSADILQHLFRYDSSYGIYDKEINSQFFCEKDPEKLPWKKLGVDIVLECTGVFRDRKGAGKHLKAGAKKVIISAPAKDDDIPSFVIGVNKDIFDPKKDDIVDMGSCTTNCLAPVAKILDDNLGIVNGHMTTIHSYTNGQKILDMVHKDFRRARTAGANIIPTTTGATKAIGKVLPELKGKIAGMAMRIPTQVVSLIDLVCLVEKSTTAKEINSLFKKASAQDNFNGILSIEEAPLVSMDYKGNTFSAIVDAESTSVKDKLVKVIAWYDNEYAYACRLAEFAEFIGKKL